MASSAFVTYTAAHAGFAVQSPLGGGATIATWLNDQWHRTRPFNFVVLGPGAETSSLNYRRLEIDSAFQNLTELTERQYARFCRLFERATTEFILREAEQRPVSVLANDISEGPDFEVLSAHGIPITTIFHVDVVDYFCKFYLRGVRPERMTRWYERLRACGLQRFVPAMLRLVFEKQRAAVMHSRHLIVPSGPMKEIILRCYPTTPPERIQIVPWGRRAESVDHGAVAREKPKLRDELSLRDGDLVLVTLGRLSPEKGIERLLNALRSEEQGLAARPRVLICGDAAYMRGQRYLRSLKARARSLRSVRVDFLGHLVGARKQAVLELADLFVHPSRHESYGLTIVEAMHARCAVLTTDHYSARELVTRACGIVTTNEAELAFGLRQLLRERRRLFALGENAHARAASMRFADAADRIAALMAEGSSRSA